MADSKLLFLSNLKRVGNDWELRRAVFLLAIPSVGEQVLNTAVGLTDQFLVGHLDPTVAVAMGYDRATALASVGLANMLVWITTTLFMAVAVGATAIVARRIGEGRVEDANVALVQGLLLSLLVGVLGTLIAFFGGEGVLRLLGASETVTQIGAGYLRIVSLSFVPAALMFAGTAALRGAGDTRSPLYLMAVVNFVNILLSWLLVNGSWGFPALGVNGSAIGTAISRTLAGVLLMGLFMLGRMRLKVSGGWQPHRETIQKIIKIGLPSAGEQFIFQSAILVMAAFLTTLGTAAYAAHTVAVNIESVSFLPGFGFAIAATAMVGQALGAGDPELAERATWEALLQGGLMMTVMGLIMAAWPATIISWIAPDPAVIEQAVGPLRLAGLGQPLLAMAFILVGALRGAGDTTWPLGMRVVSTWIVRVPLMVALLAWTEWGLFAIWLAMFADFAMQGALSFARFRGGRWKHIQV